MRRPTSDAYSDCWPPYGGDYCRVPVAAVLGILSLSLDEIFMRGQRSLMLGICVGAKH